MGASGAIVLVRMGPAEAEKEPVAFLRKAPYQPCQPATPTLFQPGSRDGLPFGARNDDGTLAVGERTRHFRSELFGAGRELSVATRAEKFDGVLVRLLYIFRSGNHKGLTAFGAVHFHTI